MIKPIPGPARHCKLIVRPAQAHPLIFEPKPGPGPRGIGPSPAQAQYFQEFLAQARPKPVGRAWVSPKPDYTR